MVLWNGLVAVLVLGCGPPGALILEGAGVRGLLVACRPRVMLCLWGTGAAVLVVSAWHLVEHVIVQFIEYLRAEDV